MFNLKGGGVEDKLTREEEEYLRELLSHHDRAVRGLMISANLFRVFGGPLLVVTACHVIKNRTDDAISFVGGIMLVNAYSLLPKRARKLKKLGSILTKLSMREIAA
jgi:hypothetical protein